MLIVAHRKLYSKFRKITHFHLPVIFKIFMLETCPFGILLYMAMGSQNRFYISPTQ